MKSNEIVDQIYKVLESYKKYASNTHIDHDSNLEEVFKENFLELDNMLVGTFSLPTKHID